MKETLQELRPFVLEIFEYLHGNPEVSWREYNTTKYISSKLKEIGCSVTTFDDCTGVIGEIGSGPLTVALRADLDALWQEVNGEFRANHSCGHDAHMTLVLGALMLIKEIGYEPKGKLKLIFQPAEEKGTGALKLVEKGVIDDVDYLYGVHLRPFQEVENGKAAPAIINGAGQFIKGEIRGADAHGARPHLNVNAIEVGAAIVHELNRIHLNPMVPYSAKMTRFVAGGDNSNTIPGNAKFSIDLRAQSNKVMEELVARVEHMIFALGKLYDTEIHISYESKVGAAEVDEQAKRIMADAITSVLGSENLVNPVITPGGEDFHYYTIKRPHVKATMLGLGCDLRPGLHHPHMTFNREALLNGIEILAKTVMLTFEEI
ncbi:M20 peptidase aminoacylase family protein [Ammoniphilus sp. CFH 90114]|uniref:M20 peptidase aminoacylase family protein n=1 Tax=Ammoniphilus sp. CFH 90114 TaxID=2493665 RepID=UPI00100FBE24|nr:M20 peptidase aminoacylase family protein [Ammoniphilus sp. CFH 90114]RXT06474.1 amidohydrolase [Ammoniphilus sp. CFH 90114]